MSDEIQQNTEAMENLTSSVNATTLAQKQFDDILSQTEAERIERQKNLGKAWEDAKSAVSSFGSAMLSTEQGQSKYGSAVKDATSAVGNIAKSFGPIGFVVGQLVDVIGKIVGSALEVNDATVKNYDELSKLGINIGMTSSEMLSAAHETGFSTKTLQKFQNIANELGPALLMLGDSSANGLKKFSKIANISEEELIRFRKLGYSNNELRDTMAQYVKMNAFTGTLRGKTDEEIRALSLEYAANLSTVASLTGQKREIAEKMLEQAKQELSYKIFQRQMGDKKANNGERIVDVADKIVSNLGVFGKTYQKGFADLVSSKGQNISDSAEKMLQATGNEGAIIAAEVNAGKISAEEGTLRIIRSMKPIIEQAEKMGDSQYVKAALEARGIDSEVYDAYLKVKDLTAEQMAEQARKTKEVQTSTIDGLVADRAKQDAAELKTQQSLDKLQKQVGESLSSAIANLTSVFNGAIDWVVKLPFFSGLDPRVSNKKSSVGEMSEINAFGGDIGETEEPVITKQAQDPVQYLRELSSEGKLTDFGSGDKKLQKYIESLAERGAQVSQKEYDFLKTRKVEIPSNLTVSAAPVVEKGARDGGVFVGDSSGYAMKLHGKEAVIPMGSSNAITVTEADNGGDSEIFEIVSEMLDRLTSLMKDNTQMQTDIFRHMANGGV